MRRSAVTIQKKTSQRLHKEICSHNSKEDFTKTAQGDSQPQFERRLREYCILHEGDPQPQFEQRFREDCILHEEIRSHNSKEDFAKTAYCTRRSAATI
jgi:hypothetical protein